MTSRADIPGRLSRLEEARRQTQRQLDLIDRQIIRRMTGIIPALSPKHMAYRRRKAPDPQAFLERYRSQLAALTAELQPEIDALSRRIAWQDRVIAALREWHNPWNPRYEVPGIHRPKPICHSGMMEGPQMDDWTRAAFERLLKLA